MHLDGRHANRLHRVEQGDARVRIRAGVDHDAVRRLISPLNRIHQSTFMVALHKINRHAKPLCLRADHRHKVAVGAFAVDIRLPQAKQIQVWAVDDENLHALSPIISVGIATKLLPDLLCRIFRRCFVGYARVAKSRIQRRAFAQHRVEVCRLRKWPAFTRKKR
ncbi:hypothetical protein SDC9_172524 [bioreactor metagenome]|uniref:Uncharacterized protein n=1 Tax=bioreactor metagenome TaxID=1076179 RepID=A0A645GDY3_9ZZZZ